MVAASIGLGAPGGRCGLIRKVERVAWAFGDQLVKRIAGGD